MPSKLPDLGKDSIGFLIVCGNSGGSHFYAVREIPILRSTITARFTDRGYHTAARPIEESSPNEWTTRDDMSAIMNLISHARFDFTKVYGRIASPLDADKIYDEPINDRSFPVTLFDRDTVED